MRYLALCLVVFAWSPDFARAQAFDLQFDHSTVLVNDLEISGNFYRDILQLEELETPWGKNDSIRFFSIGGNRQLHMARIDRNGDAPGKVIHLAFAVKDFDAYLAFLAASGIEYSNFAGDSKEPQTRPDGVKQVYFQDPDGNWIEINNATY